MKTEQKNIFLWLMIFNEVVEQGSFTAAADKLNLTKSGVSQHVSRLEQYLDIQILRRSTRSLSLTSAGEKLFQRSGELKTLLNITLDEVNNIKQQPTGTLSITASHALIQPAVLPAIKQLVKHFPNIKPRLIVDDGTQDIIKKGIDVAIRVGVLKDSKLKAKKIGNIREVFVVSSSYLSSLTKPISIQDIETHPFIATSWQITNYHHHFLDENKKSHNIYLQPNFEVSAANTAMELVFLDLGVALLPSIYASKYLKEGKVQQVLSKLQAKTDNIYYVHAYKENVPLKIKWFIEFLKKQL